MADCKHLSFRAEVRVNRLTASETDDTVIAYNAEIIVKCVDCDTPFEFIGLPMGMSHHEPMVSVDCLEARIPIKPKGTPMSADLTGFALRRVK